MRYNFSLLINAVILLLNCLVLILYLYIHFCPTALKGCWVLFSPMVSRWAGGRLDGRWEKVCLGCISETVRCRKFILGRDIGQDM